MTNVLPYNAVQIQLTPDVTLAVRTTSGMVKVTTGLSIAQVSMLRACFEDEYGVDPATLTSDEIFDLFKEGK